MILSTLGTDPSVLEANTIATSITEKQFPKLLYVSEIAETHRGEEHD